jgi:signal transduction histidine kinase
MRRCNDRRDGSLFWNELHIAPVRDPDSTVRHCLGVQTDVSVRVEAERELAMRNARLDAVMSLSPDGFVLFDATDRLVYVNEALSAMLGVGPAELAGLTRGAFEPRLAASCAPADGPVADPRRASPESGQRTLEVVRPQRRILQCTERTHARHGGETVLCFRDVTRETEIDRMKSEFLTTAAHELRTPLVSVFGYAELLIARASDAPKRQRMLQTIHPQAKLPTSMIDDLLDLAKIEVRRGREVVLYPVPVGMLVDGAPEGLAAVEAPRDVELDVEVGARTVEVAVDPDRTRQAITSVLSDACRCSAPGSPVRLSVRTGTGPDGPAVLVTVVDRGIGMSAESSRPSADSRSGRTTARQACRARSGGGEQCSPEPRPHRWSIGLTSRRVAPTNSWRGRPIFWSGSEIISFHCAIQPTVRASAKMQVNIDVGMPSAFCTMPE